jgi:hypothetical protein
MAPEQYAEQFLSKTPFPQDKKLVGVYGRFTRGVKPEDFEMLSDEPGKRLSWVCTEELLQPLLGKNPAQALLHIGFGRSWMEQRLLDGTTHKLVLFPSAEGTIASWDGVFQMVHKAYGDEVYQKLKPFNEEIKQMPYDRSDPVVARNIEISDLPVAQKYAHPEFMVAERYLEIENPTVHDARRFYHHQIGCNHLFQGTGHSMTGEVECLVLNQKIKDIHGSFVVDLLVTKEELDAEPVQQ